jgi:hypothetical protein
LLVINRGNVVSGESAYDHQEPRDD